MPIGQLYNIFFGEIILAIVRKLVFIYLFIFLAQNYLWMRL